MVIAAVVETRRDEFIEDRSISREEDDSFGHKDVVQELAHLALKGPASSNIALFAPWGTGKSGIAKLLKPAIEKDGAKFVYFDAFKHRATPLRRSFLRTAVAALKPKFLKAIDTKLYGETVTQALKSSDKWKLFWMIVGGVIGALLLTGIVTWGLAKLNPGPFDEDFPGLFAKTSGMLALVGGLVGVALTTLVNGYSVTKTSKPVAEDDEFEREFTELVNDTRGRVVIFVDELDRCSAEEVVETLETMRVFLEVKGCVFIVAIDQKSLEQALRHRARQETPIDESHPYFSSAGSYVDKIFQYQLALPPLRSRDMTVFVEDLLAERDGCWAQLNNWGEHADVIGALTPTHVTSPRRIKVLLNAYVIAHRLAAQRAAAKQMVPLRNRAAALAQLVCLRTEFSLFAEDLEQFPELPEALLAQERGEHEAKVRNRAPRTWTRAAQYSEGKLPTSRLLLEATRNEDRSTGADAPRAAIENVNRQQLRNLIGYLERVERLPTISGDLVYLHSAAGSNTNVEPEIADQLEQAARDGAPEQIAEVLDELDGQQEAEALRLMVSILASAATGSLDAENASHVLLSVFAAHADLPRAIADFAADEIVRKIGRRELSPRDRAAAIDLARRCSEVPAGALIRLVTSSGDLLADSTVRSTLIAADRDLPPSAAKQGAPALARAIESDDGESIDAWAELQAKRRTALLDTVADTYRAALKRGDELAEGETSADATSVPELQPHCEWVLDHLLKQSTERAEEFTAFLIRLGRVGFTSIAEARLDQMAPIEQPDLLQRVLDRTAFWDLEQRLRWLKSVGETDLNDETASQLAEVVAKTWKDVIDEAQPLDETVDAVLNECQRLLSKSDEIPTRQTAKAIQVSLESAFPDETSAERLLRAIRMAKQLSDRGLIAGRTPADALVEAVASALGHVEPGQPGTRPVLASALEEVLPWFTKATQEAVGSLHSAAEAAPADTLSEVRLRAIVASAAELKQRGEDVQSPPLEELLAQIDGDRAAWASTVSVWATELAPSGTELWAVLSRYWDEEIPPAIRTGFRSGIARLGQGEHKALATLALEAVIDGSVPQPANWEAIDLKGIGATWVVEELRRLIDVRQLDEAGWRRVLEICLQLKTTNAHAQLRIGEMLLIPLAAIEGYGFGLAVENLGLVGKGSTGREIVERIAKLADSPERQQLLVDQLESESWSTAAAKRVSEAIRGLFGGSSSG